MQLVSASEDSFVRVWKLSAEDKPTVSFFKTFTQIVTVNLYKRSFFAVFPSFLTFIYLPLQMEMVFQQSIADVQLCGAKFVDLSGDTFGVTGYDLSEIVMFTKQ